MTTGNSTPNVRVRAEQWTIGFYVKNLTDERTIVGADSTLLWGPRANAVVLTPRRIGVIGTYYFD